jgi:hypothetical protein
MGCAAESFNSRCECCGRPPLRVWDVTRVAVESDLWSDSLGNECQWPHLHRQNGPKPNTGLRLVQVTPRPGRRSLAGHVSCWRRLARTDVSRMKGGACGRTAPASGRMPLSPRYTTRWRAPRLRQDNRDLTQRCAAEKASTSRTTSTARHVHQSGQCTSPWCAGCTACCCG